MNEGLTGLERHEGEQGRAETFGGAGAQSIKGAHGTRFQ